MAQGVVAHSHSQGTEAGRPPAWSQTGLYCQTLSLQRRSSWHSDSTLAYLYLDSAGLLKQNIFLVTLKTSSWSFRNDFSACELIVMNRMLGH